MSFTIHIKYIDEPEIQITSPPYRVSAPETGEHISLTPMKHGSHIGELPIFVIRNCLNGAVVVDKWILEGTVKRKLESTKFAVGICFTKGGKNDS